MPSHRYLLVNKPVVETELTAVVVGALSSWILQCGSKTKTRVIPSTNCTEELQQFLINVENQNRML
ncbi:MAG: hypothetical protein HQM14_21355 [SAR324 cluster bacterium]|nr:hypothetical protein [SAR324 cluster bacterium]